MTSQFWKWLSRANARTALLAAAVALTAVLAYWIWREIQPGLPAGAGLGRSGGGGAVDAAPTNRVELLGFVQKERQAGVPSIRNPFSREPVRRPGTESPRPPSRPELRPPPRPRPDTRPEPRPQPPPPAKEVPLLFRGIMLRPDGQAMALIENQETKRQRFYGPGDPFLGGTVERVDAESVAVKRPGGGTAILPRGQPVRVREE